MADNELNIVISATDKASAALKGVRGSIITLNQGLQLAQQAFGMVKKVVEESISAYVKYADEVRQLSRLNGTTAEETSRLIQVMDDHKVSVSALTMATRKLSQEGLSLTIDSLAKMSDEYKGLSTSAEKTRFLLDKFGRSGLQMAETMEQGGESIKSQSAAISQSLILTEKSMRAARQYEMALDQLNDTKMGLAITVGGKLIPAWNDSLQRLNNLISVTNMYELQTVRLISILRDMPIGSATNSYMAMAESIELANKEQADINTSFEELKKITEQIAGGESLKKIAYDMMGVAFANGEISFEEWNNFGVALGILTPRASELAASIDRVTQAALTGSGPIEAYAKIIAYLNSLAGSYSYNYTVTTSGGNYNPYTQQGTTNPYKGKPPKPKGDETPWPGDALGGSIPAGGMAWVGDSPSGLTPHSELVYAPHGAQVFNANQSRSMGAGGSPRAFTGGMIGGSSGEMSLSNETIRRLASEIAGAVKRDSG